MSKGNRPVPLTQRMTQAQMERRADKIAARIATVNVRRDVDLLGNIMMTDFKKKATFWGRLKWLVTGK